MNNNFIILIIIIIINIIFNYLFNSKDSEIANYNRHNPYNFRWNSNEYNKNLFNY